MEGFKLPERFIKKENERRLEKERKKEERTDVTGVEKFVQEFEEVQKSIQMSLSNVENSQIDSQALKDHFNQISSELAHLQTIFSHFSVALPQFQMRKYQTVLFDLVEKSQTLQEKLVPKKKFSFKNRKYIDGNTKDVPGSKKNVSTYDVPDGTLATPKLVFANDCGFSDKTNESLTLYRTDVAQKDVSLSNLDKSIVRVYGTPSTVHITNVKNSTILIGPVSTSVFVEDCLNSDIIVTCQQLRVHNTSAVNFYIHVTSRCIIEDSVDICVAPYCWNYDSLQEDLSSSGLDLNSNNWSDIDDFNWLAKDKASPNWTVLSEDKRKTFS